MGTDYSGGAVELAREVAAAEGVEIAYHVRDLLDAAAHADLGPFDVVLDKGTYDAVTLNPDSAVRWGVSPSRPRPLPLTFHCPLHPDRGGPLGRIHRIRVADGEGGRVRIPAGFALVQSRGASPLGSLPPPLALAHTDCS